MKKFVKEKLVILTLFISLMGYANDGSIELNENVLTLSLENVKKETLITIRDGENAILYKERVQNHGAYYKSFDFSTLPDGDYIIEIDKDIETNIVPFDMVSGKVKFNPNAKYSINKPLIVENGEKVTVSKLAFEEDMLEVKIFDSNSVLLFEEKLEDEKSIQRVYNFSQVEKGEYVIVVNSGGRSYREYLKF